MSGKSHVRYIASFVLVVLIVIGLCGVALAAASNSQPVKSAGTSSKPTSSQPTNKAKLGWPPIVTSVSPLTGREGDTITVKGFNFGSIRGTSYVMFGLFKAAVYPVWSDTQIQVVVPKITSLIWPMAEVVTVITSNGMSIPWAFMAYAPKPTVTAIIPPVWIDNSVATIAIVGTNFQNRATVTLYQKNGTHTFAVSNVLVTSSTAIAGKITIPKYSEIPKPAGSTSVPPYYAVVTNPDGGSGSGGTFNITKNPCGTGAAPAIVGFGLMMGAMTLAGTIRVRRRRVEKS